MSRRPRMDLDASAGEYGESSAFGMDVGSGDIHRRHSLTASVFQPAEDEDEAGYEDSDFGVRVPHVDVTKEHLDEAHLVEPPVEKAREEDRKHGNRAPFIACPWEATFDRTRPTAIAPNGFVAQPKKANGEQKTIFALAKSRDLSAEVLALCAREHAYEKLVSLLLIRDTFEPFAVDINFADPSNGQTPLMAACAAGMLDVVQLLYECSFNWVIGYPLDVDQVDFTGTTALMKAAQNGHLVLVKYLLEILQARVDAVDYDGWSALMFAAAKGHWHIVEYLVLARGADVLECTVQGDTPLMLAANNGYLNVVRFLVEETDAGDRFDEEALREKEERRRREREEAGEEEEAEEQQQQEDAKEQVEDEEEEDGEENEDEEEADGGREDSAAAGRPKRATKKRRDAGDAPASDGPTPEQLAAQQKALQAAANKTQRRGLEQANLKGWTALLGAAHYGQLYVIHYLVSRGANPDLTARSGHSSRDIPMSLLAHNRHGVPVIQPQVLAAIEKGLRDRGKEKRNVKRNAVEKSLIRFKRAERLMLDGDSARLHSQYECAHLLYSFAFATTRASKLVKEESELRAKAKAARDQMEQACQQVVQWRGRAIKEMLEAEAKRNFFLAERYIQDKAYTVALQCLAVCLQYEPTNEQYLDKEAYVKRQQSAKSSSGVVDAPPPSTSPAPKPDEQKAAAVDPARAAEEVKPPRSCSLFGFSFF